jgi:hypothetical protein
MSLQEILEEQKKQVKAALVIQKAWTRYWYKPFFKDGEEISRYGEYMRKRIPLFS